jgi:cation diffusion facilitator family transporter
MRMPEHAHAHADAHGHGHTHSLLPADRSREGLRVVGAALLVLLATAVAQVLIFAVTGSVALLADLTHNAGDALTAIPLGIAFFLRSRVAERRAGAFVVLAIFVSACVAGVESVLRLADPRSLDHLGALAAAGVIGFAGNELAARVRLRGGARLGSAALIADGRHARTDGLVSLGVVASAACVAIGFPLGDPLVGLAITAIILRVTWQSFHTIRDAPAG